MTTRADLWRALEAERDALARRIEAVRALHTPREEQVVTGDCSIEECDHEDECPTVPFAVCAECWRVADEADTYFAERGVGHVAYPCPTIRALDGQDGPAPRAIPADREVIQYGPTPDQLDEVVLSGVDVHIEQMDTNWYWMCFQRGEDRLVIHLGADRAPVNGTVIEDDLNIRRTP